MNDDAPSLGVTRAVARSDVGRVRARNEDLTFIDPQLRWAILADGMGGYHGGDVAARIGVESASRTLERTYVANWGVAEASLALSAAAAEANLAVYQAGGEDPDLVNMGSTLLAVCPVGGGLVSVHVGDSRLYRLRRGSLLRLTRDHTLLQEFVDEGVLSEDDVRLSGARGVLTRALGVHETVEPEVRVHDLASDDLFLMCSDGLTDMLHEQDIAELLSADTLETAADALVLAANTSGGRDNISVILIRIG